jgi:hypothetical protein
MRGVGRDGDGVKAVMARGEDGGAATGGEDGGAAAGGEDEGAAAGGASSWAPVASPSAPVRISFGSGARLLWLRRASPSAPVTGESKGLGLRQGMGIELGEGQPV